MGDLNPLLPSLRATLLRSLNQRSSEEAAARKSTASLQISVQADDAIQWSGGNAALALMRPAPDAGADDRWAKAAAQLPLPLAHFFVDRPAGVAFGYPQVQVYAAALPAAATSAQPQATRLALALPGPDHGLDESACVEHLLLGLLDTLAAPGAAASPLEEIVLLEPLEIRRKLIVEKLHLLFPDGSPAGSNRWTLAYFPAASAGQPRVPAPFEQRLTIQDTLTAFVAMPFAPRMVDVFRYGIKAPSLRCRFKAERLDFEHYTGSIVEEIKDRIQRAHLVIADLTGANANVFLEIGYAWGKGRPTLLLRGIGDMAVPQDKDRPPFDVEGDVRIEYDSIGSLEAQLNAKLAALYPELRRRAAGGV